MRNQWHVPLLLAAALAGCLDPDEPGNLVPKTVEEDPSLPRIEINGSVFHAETFGDPANPMIMMLHGGPGSDYRSLLPLSALADDGYFVVFWDQRGSGLSKRHNASEYSFELILEDLRQVIDYYGDRPMVFIGHSWGAMYATWFINTYGSYGGRIRGAVLSEPGAFTDEQLDAYFARHMEVLNFFDEDINDIMWVGQTLTPADHARADYAAMFMTPKGLPADHVDPKNPGPAFRAGAVANVAVRDLGEADGFDWTTNLSSFTPTVFFLRGELNEAMPLWHQQALASSYPSSELVTIPGVGHEMIWERPAEYLAEVRAYFQRIGFEGGMQ